MVTIQVFNAVRWFVRISMGLRTTEIGVSGKDLKLILLITRLGQFDPINSTCLTHKFNLIKIKQKKVERHCSSLAVQF